MRWLAIAHAVPGRTRLRCPSLRGDPAACERVADALAATAGVAEVRVRPYTGSVLVTHARDVSAAALAEAAARAAACERLLAIGERPPLDDVPELASVARKAATAARGLDADILRATGGRLDLGTLATMVFFGAGALEVAVQRKLPMPPWFNLAWWGVRTFMTAERAEILAEDDEGAGAASATTAAPPPPR